ncbi:MAG: hypothetical protein QXY55_02485, partial [Candidatus Korarchaeota archaeon]|nr:hypothetical protein [Thermoproteota archaeon]
IAEEMKMQVAIASIPLAKLLEKIPKLPLEPQVIDKYVNYPAPFQRIPIESVEEKTLILVSYREIVDLIKDLNLTGSLSEDCLAIISESEPQIEEGSEYTVIANWFSMMGIESYRVRVSGHYYQYQLKTILEKIKPRKGIKRIHTEKPEIFLKAIKAITKLPQIE